MIALKAFGFYFQCGLRNALFSFIKRLRQPRYLIGLMVIVLYISWVLTINLRNMSEDEAVAGEAFRITDFVRAFFLVQVLIIWLFARGGRGFNFKPAETALLFSAPLRRRDILLFKWLQVMPPVMILSSLVAIFALFSAVCHPIYAPIGIFLAWNLVHLHQILIRLTMQWLREKGLLGNLVAWCLQLLPLPLLGIPLWLTIESVARTGEFKPLHVLVNPPFSQIWDALRVFSDPALAQNLGEFGAALPPLLVLIALHAWLVLRCDIAFEDQAIERAEKLSRVKTEGVDALRSNEDFVLPPNHRPLLKLDPTGPLWRAMVWKNLLSMGRLGRRRMIMAVVFSIYFAGIGMFIFGKLSDGVAAAIFGGVAVLLPYFSILAPALIRVDLRIDIPHFDLIKSLPIRGRELLFGEIFAGALLATMAQSLLIAIGSIALIQSGEGYPLDTGDIICLSIALLVALAGLNVALFAIANLIALYFPSITKLGRGVKVGIDQMGVQFIGAIVRSFAIGVELLIPLALGGLAAAGLYFGLDAGPRICGPVAALIFSVALIIENLLIIRVAEGRYDRFDLSQEKTNIA